MTIEDMCRGLLEEAIESGLVVMSDPMIETDRLDPEQLSAGDLVGMANLLSEYLSEK